MDLHGAPGSQNGYDNSGQLTSNPTWGTNETNVNWTIEILASIAENAGGLIDILELLNEAAGFRSNQWASTIRQFWRDGYDAVREVAEPSMKIMIGDAFLGVQNWEGFLTYPSAQGVMMDLASLPPFFHDIGRLIVPNPAMTARVPDFQRR